MILHHKGCRAIKTLLVVTVNARYIYIIYYAWNRDLRVDMHTPLHVSMEL